MKKIRLHQFLSRTGIFKNKKEIFDRIRNKEIFIENRTVTNPEFQFNPKKKKVFWKGKQLKQIEKNIYIIMNKPEGFLSSRLTSNDINLGKRSVFELIEMEKSIDEKTKKTLFCIGRLDEDTSGLIIITNDGKLSYKIMNPENKIEKTYLALLKKPLDEKTKSKIENGITIELEENGKIKKYRTKECRIKIKDVNNIEITICEGKKREIRRIFEAVGNKVERLQRIKIGNISLKELGLKKGEYILVDKEFIQNIL